MIKCLHDKNVLQNILLIFQVSVIMLLHVSKGKYHIFPNWKSVFRIFIHNGWLHISAKETDCNAFSYVLYNNSHISVKLEPERWSFNSGPMLVQSRLSSPETCELCCVADNGNLGSVNSLTVLYHYINIHKCFPVHSFFLPVYHYPDIHNGLHPEEARLLI